MTIARDTLLATISAQNGDGFTLPVTSCNTPTWNTGYMVGRSDIMPSLRCDGTHRATIAMNVGIACKVAESLGLFAESQGLYDMDFAVGGWRDSETGLYWVDISQRFDDLDRALALAEELGELAIWDLANNREIRVD